MTTVLKGGVKNMEKKQSLPKEKYEKPRIVYEKKIEVLAVVCDSGSVSYTHLTLPTILLV